MNIETGEIKRFTYEEMLNVMEDPYVPINESDMTVKQNEFMQVSKHDNKSKLGKKFTTARAKRKWKAKQIKKSSFSMTNCTDMTEDSG